MVINEQQKRLDLLFEMDNIKCYLIPYIAPGVSLKVITDLGYKDKFGNKKKFYEETRYKSNKYNNSDYLISGSIRINSYLVLEYPNPNYDEKFNIMRNNGLLIRGYSIDDVVERMREFNKVLASSFCIKNNEVCLLSDRAKEVIVYPSIDSSLSFKPDIYEDQYGKKEIGVKIVINNEYSFIISAENTWPELVYKLSRCDLTMLGLQMVQSYMSLLPGMAVTDLNSNKYSYRYRPYWEEDVDDIVNRPSSVKINSKPISKEDKKKSFFDEV